LLLATGAHASEPKKLLVVTVTTGFRHGSIATAEKVLEKLAAESKLFTVDLRNYDGVIFANTTGDLPLPDKDGFIQWLQSGKAFIGMHSATDTFHGFRPYIEMIGGEFDGHPWSQPVTVRVDDAGNPASKSFPKEFEINDEIYQFKSYSRADKDVLLQLDSSNEERPKVAPKKDATPLGFFQRGKRTDGDYAVSWVKTFGKGRVFYTSLGHRDQVWEDPRYQEHILGGIRWALDLN
jgi:type 1 glutamine amidotransferase